MASSLILLDGVGQDSNIVMAAEGIGFCADSGDREFSKVILGSETFSMNFIQFLHRKIE